MWRGRARHAGNPHNGADAATDLDRKIGNLFLFGFSGNTPDKGGVQRAADYLKQGKLGGVLFLQRNIRSRRDIALINARFKDAVPGAAPLISIDHEGGLVQRLRRPLGFTTMPAARVVADTYRPDEAEAVYAIAARELAQTGFTLNLGPVVDLHDAENGVIGRAGRAYGADTDQVSAYATAFINAYRASGILCAVKHFPGHGRSRGDSHHRSVDITATWKPDELIPYKTLIKSGSIDVIMSGHLAHAQLTGGGEPATFSSTTINGLLRGTLAYRGLAVTDDLTMAGARRHGSTLDIMIRSLQAGHDMLLIAKPAGSSGRFVDHAIAGIRHAVTSGRLPASVIDAAYDRVMTARMQIT